MTKKMILSGMSNTTIFLKNIFDTENTGLSLLSIKSQI